jgi:hypothetical protein
MPDALLDRAARTAGRVSAYAVVPFVLTLLAFDNVAQTAAASGFQVSLKFALPTAVPTLWTVFDPPASGINFVTPTSLSLLPVYLLVDAVLTAGYLGGIHDAANGSQTDFVDSAVSYVAPVLGVRIVEFVVVGTFALLAISGGFATALLAFPVLLVAGYVLWGAPFLVVARDQSALDAIAWNVRIALDSSDYLSFSIGFAVVTAVVSVFVSLLLSGGNVVTVVVMAAVIAYPGLVASAAAMHVVDEAAAQSRGP